MVPEQARPSAVPTSTTTDAQAKPPATDFRSGCCDPPLSKRELWRIFLETPGVIEILEAERDDIMKRYFWQDNLLEEGCLEFPVTRAPSIQFGKVKCCATCIVTEKRGKMHPIRGNVCRLHLLIKKLKAGGDVMYHWRGKLP
jgi:hypothetical protein